METKDVFLIWNHHAKNVLVSSSRFIWTPMLWVYDYYRYFISFSVVIVFIRQNLTSKDVRFWRIKTCHFAKCNIWLSDTKRTMHIYCNQYTCNILHWTRHIIRYYKTLLFKNIKPLTAKLLNWNFHSLQVVFRWRDPQLQESGNYSDLTKWSRAVLFYVKRV